MQFYKSRYMQELTWREVNEYLKRSDIAVIPVGSNEVHGALLPQGSDTFVAQAVSLKLAEKIDALIAPPITYTYSGGTKNIPGTISISTEVVSHYLENVILELIRNRFRRIYIIQWHAPYYSHQQLTRELFEKTGIPVVFFGLMNMPVVSQLSNKLLKGKCKETAVVSAAMRILGKGRILDTSVESSNQKIRKRPEDDLLQMIGETGCVVGHYFSHESQHVAFCKELNTETGLAIIEAIVKTISGTADNLQKYIRILQGK